jgi:type IV pilus assembly protein PilC
MATFAFKAMDLTGAKAAGTVEADSKQSVADQLKARGLIVLDITAKSGSGELKLDFLKRIKPADLTIMTRQLATMVSSGMTILRALYVLEGQTENDKLKDVLVDVRKDVEAGLPLSDALERHPKVFSPLYVAMTRAGETGGILEESLQRIADQLEDEDKLRRLVLTALVVFIVPVFVGVFKQFGGDLPSITKITVGLSHLMTHQWYLIIAAIVGVIVAFRKWKSSEKGRGQWDAFRLRIPMKIGEIVQKIALARWSRTLSSLVKGGVPLLQALEITGQTAGNRVIENAMGSVIESVRSGGTIHEPLKDVPVFPTMVTHMVGVGEETGALDEMLSKIADFYEDQVEAAVKSLTSILEPVMLVFVGGIVGFIVISMYLPLFKVYDQIR